MEEQQPILELINSGFGQKMPDMRKYSPLTLAYIGDAVFDLIVRTLLVEQANTPVKKLHLKACSIVKAKSQAHLILSIEDELTDEEYSIFKRGRNAKASSVAKNAEIHDYRNATGFEALFGYLYLSGHLNRAIDLMKLGMERLNISL